MEHPKILVYEKYWTITDIFPISKNGIQTGHDKFAVDLDIDNLRKRIHDFFDIDVSEDTIKKKYALKDKAGWSLSAERQKSFSEGILPKLFVSYFYRPFDLRSLFYSKRVLKRPVNDIMDHFLENNFARSSFCI